MTSTLNIQLPDALRRFVDMRASDNDIYATPSEYIRDLIRKDLKERDYRYDHDLADHLVLAMESPIENHPIDFLAQEKKRLTKNKISRFKK